jgi:hypothetical protein
MNPHVLEVVESKKQPIVEKSKDTQWQIDTYESILHDLEKHLLA